MTQPEIFVRKSSGLRKEVSLLDAVMLNIGNMSAGLALFTSISPYVQQGSSLWVASIIGLLLALPQAFMYTYLSSRIPRTGGDYVWISRILGGPLGTVLALSLMIESLAYFAITAFFSSQALQTVIMTIGTVDSQQNLVSLSSVLSNSTTDYLIGALIFGAIILFNIVRARWGYLLVSILGVISLISTVTAFFVLLSNSGHFLSNPGLDTYITSLGVNPSSIPREGYSFSLSDTIFMLPLFALFTYPWMQAGPAVASEFRGRSVVKFNIFVSLLLTGLIVTGGFYVMYAGAGFTPTNYLFMNPNTQYAYSFWSAAIAMAPNQVVQWVIGIGTFTWEVMVLAYGVIVFARYIFAISFDRVLPEIFSRISTKGSPVYTHLLDLVVTLGLLSIPVFSSQGAIALYGAVILGTLYFAFVGLAGIIFSVKNRVPLVTIASVITLLYFAYLTYDAVVNPSIGFVTASFQPNPITLGFVIGTLVLSALVYAVSYFMNKSRGIDLNMVYKEIPPD